MLSVSHLFERTNKYWSTSDTIGNRLWGSDLKKDPSKYHDPIDKIVVRQRKNIAQKHLAKNLSDKGLATGASKIKGRGRLSK